MAETIDLSSVRQAREAVPLARATNSFLALATQTNNAGLDTKLLLYEAGVLVDASDSLFAELSPLGSLLRPERVFDPGSAYRRNHDFHVRGAVNRPITLVCDACGSRTQRLLLEKCVDVAHDSLWMFPDWS